MLACKVTKPKCLLGYVHQAITFVDCKGIHASDNAYLPNEYGRFVCVFIDA